MSKIATMKPVRTANTPSAQAHALLSKKLDDAREALTVEEIDLIDPSYLQQLALLTLSIKIRSEASESD